jgi:ABC-type sulfate transport system permease subunit
VFLLLPLVACSRGASKRLGADAYLEAIDRPDALAAIG